MASVRDGETKQGKAVEECNCDFNNKRRKRNSISTGFCVCGGSGGRYRTISKRIQNNFK